jgi:ArsR family transcriptional regulator, arsenate/arsenite/antimonite-responsive transcriptional repressor
MTRPNARPSTQLLDALLDDESAAGVARALAHPARVRILRILSTREECYCGDLCQEFSLAQSTVSQHLKVLKEAGLVRATPCGTAVGYCVEKERLAAFHHWLEHLAGAEA